MNSQLSKFLRYYRVIFFWLVVALGVVLGTQPVVASAILTGLATLGFFIHTAPTPTSVPTELK